MSNLTTEDTEATEDLLTKNMEFAGVIRALRANAREEAKRIEVLQRERDEAREKIKRQTERIRELEGATNHSCGTPLTIALCERDEAIRQRNETNESSKFTCDFYRKERDEAREKLNRITSAAQAVVDRWEQPSWKDTEPTAAVIYRLRDALQEARP